MYKVTKVEIISTGKRLANLIDERGWTQETFAGIIDKSVQTVSSWVNDNSKIRTNTLVQIAEKLDVDVDYLLCKQIDPKKKNKIEKFNDLTTNTELAEQLQSIREFEKLHNYLEFIGFRIEDVFEGINATGDTAEYQFIEGNKLYTVEEQLFEPAECKKHITFTDTSSIDVPCDEVDAIMDSIKKYITFQFESLKKG